MALSSAKSGMWHALMEPANAVIAIKIKSQGNCQAPDVVVDICQSDVIFLLSLTVFNVPALRTILQSAF